MLLGSDNGKELRVVGRGSSESMFELPELEYPAPADSFLTMSRVSKMFIVERLAAHHYSTCFKVGQNAL